MHVTVNSEIGSLRSVLVHTPGPELLAVTPSNREDYLYDDIIDVEIAQREHRRFVAILERFATVHHVSDLLTATMGIPEARELLLGGLDLAARGVGVAEHPLDLRERGALFRRRNRWRGTSRR